MKKREVVQAAVGWKFVGPLLGCSPQMQEILPYLRKMEKSFQEVIGQLPEGYPKPVVWVQVDEARDEVGVLHLAVLPEKGNQCGYIIEGTQKFIDALERHVYGRKAVQLTPVLTAS